MPQKDDSDSKWLRFPEGFLWGASTASHQVEGGTDNQWSEWEWSAVRLAQLEKDGLIAKYGKDNFISGDAADHFHHFKDDFRLARELGHTATRISIEWSRIEPREGEFDMDAIRHYREVIASIRANGMEPFVTLWHWTFPLWFRDKGGFVNGNSAGYFARYAERMAREFPEVQFWLTLNEPEVYTSHGYWRGNWPPQERSIWRTLRVYHNLILAHRAAYIAMKRINPNAHIGIAKHNIYFEAYRGEWRNRIVKVFADYGWNFYFLNRIKGKMDFIGLNHYFHNRIKDGCTNRNENVRTNDMGWELYPEAIYHVLMDLRKYDVPVYVTENGLADAKDAQREWFIKETLCFVHRAIKKGADIRGYLHWSLMDNFEWADGFWPRFGLIEIDYATKERKPRPSAYAYKKICEDNGIKF
jgi:beta-glucosidase